VLHRAVRNGDRRSLHSLSSHIGSGSNQDCLFGTSWISFETSAGMTESNDENWVTLASRHWCDGADCHVTYVLDPGCEESIFIILGLFVIPG